MQHQQRQHQRSGSGSGVRSGSMLAATSLEALQALTNVERAISSLSSGSDCPALSFLYFAE